LLWAEGYYRGYLQIDITKAAVEAKFWGSPSVSTRNAWEVSLANFTVLEGENRVARPLGSVANGAVGVVGEVSVSGEPGETMWTLDTGNGTWFEREWADKVEMFLWYDEDFE
jgi:alkaline phosphatase D